MVAGRAGFNEQLDDEERGGRVFGMTMRQQARKA